MNTTTKIIIAIAVIFAAVTLAPDRWPPFREAHAAPSLSGCGTGASVTTRGQMAGVITIGSSATGTCTVTFDNDTSSELRDRALYPQSESGTAQTRFCTVQTATSTGRTDLYLPDGGTLDGSLKFATTSGAAFTSGHAYVFVCNW